MRCVWSVVALSLALAWHFVRSDDVNDAHTTANKEELVYSSPTPPVKSYLADHLDCMVAFTQNWIFSKAKKDDSDEATARYDGEWKIEPLEKNALPGDRGLVLKSVAKHAAISRRLNQSFHFTDKPLVVQYEVIFQDGHTCSGAYIKLLSDSPDLDLEQFRDRTPYTIMFGPDKCGNDHKVHFIFRHRNPVTGEFEEKHAKRVTEKLDGIFSDKLPHQYRLVVKPDNTFQIYIDDKLVNSGSLLEDMTPPVNPLKEIDDPTDKKPEDWDERQRIPDPDAVKPADWDEDAPAQIVDSSATRPADWLEEEPALIADPAASRPDDWDEEMDGEWEAPLVDNPACQSAPGCGPWSPPLVDNPAYKGPWRPPLIDNPDYHGKWAPKKIPNPAYFEDKDPFKMTSIAAVGFELWSMDAGIYFDNILLSDSLVDADHYSHETFALKVAQHGLTEATVWTRFLRYSSERPWLFAVYVVAIGLPLLLVVTYFCAPAKKKVSQTALHKKTDEMTRDDVIPEESEEQLLQEQEQQSTAPSADADSLSSGDTPVSRDSVSSADTVCRGDTHDLEESAEQAAESGGVTRRKLRARRE